ncbi:RVT_3 domain-containing protein [Cephalotus follicularis]|uniref:RVT_3 domain-containing protein n=1 Tax=Cephalotus follicularis TaxID=3775 RepID=A0A1Q3ARH1_CEPFO|nr:RVT_3 domain-containing protein [Cephalotus follicularis]
MAKYLAHVQSLKSAFQVFRVLKVPRAENSRADQLSKLATTGELERNQVVLVDYLDRSTISGADVMDIDVQQEPNWITPFISWLRNSILQRTQMRREGWCTDPTDTNSEKGSSTKGQSLSL